MAHKPSRRLEDPGPPSAMDADHMPPEHKVSASTDDRPPDPPAGGSAQGEGTATPRVGDEDRRHKVRDDEDRRRKERERFLQQRVLLEEREKEIQTLYGQVFQLQRSLEGAQKATAEETEKATKLTNDLEMANLKLAQSQGQLEASEDQSGRTVHDLAQRLAAMQAQLEGCAAEMEEKDLAMAALQERYGRELDILRAEVMQRKSGRDRDDAENTVLLKLLHTELERYKQQATQLQAALEHRERDDVKNTIVLGLLNAQLESGREEAKRQQDTVVEAKKQVEVLTAKLQDAYHKLLAYEDERYHVQREAVTKQEHIKGELDAQRQKADLLAAANQRLAEELDGLRTDHLQYQATSERRDKEAFEREVTLKSEAEHLRTMVAHLTRDLDTKEKEFFEKQTLLSAELDSTKAKLKHLQETHERASKDAFEQITILKAEAEQLREKHGRILEETKQTEREAFERTLTANAEADGLRSKLAQEKALAERKDKEHFERVTRLETEAEALHRQIGQLTASNERKDSEYVERTILLNAEKENWRSRYEALQLDSEAKLREMESRELVLKQELDLLRNELSTASAGGTRKAQEERELRERWEHAAHEATEEYARLREAAMQRDEESADRATALRAEIAALRNEIEGYKATVQKLEASVTENYQYKMLAQENEGLKGDVESLRNQVRTLGNQLHTARIESEILGGHRAQALQEQNARYLLRIQELEREHRMVAPLMTEMIATLHRHGLTPSLEGDAEEYAANVARTRLPGTPLSRSGSIPSPAAMGRHKITPLSSSLAADKT